MIMKDFLGHEWDIDCMGCHIIRQLMTVPGGIIKKTQHFWIHQDPLIPIQGFLVIGATRHIQSITEMSSIECDELFALIKNAVNAIKKTTNVEFLTIIQEESSRHFHLWFFPWTQEIINKYGEPSLTLIRSIMADYKQQPINEVEWNKLQESIEKIKTYME